VAIGGAQRAERIMNHDHPQGIVADEIGHEIGHEIEVNISL
jgi:hypothetical protein